MAATIARFRLIFTEFSPMSGILTVITSGAVPEPPRKPPADDNDSGAGPSAATSKATGRSAPAPAGPPDRARADGGPSIAGRPRASPKGGRGSAPRSAPHNGRSSRPPAGPRHGLPAAPSIPGNALLRTRSTATYDDRAPCGPGNRLRTHEEGRFMPEETASRGEWPCSVGFWSATMATARGCLRRRSTCISNRLVWHHDGTEARSQGQEHVGRPTRVQRLVGCVHRRAQVLGTWPAGSTPSCRCATSPGRRSARADVVAHEVEAVQLDPAIQFVAVDRERLDRLDQRHQRSSGRSAAAHA